MFEPDIAPARLWIGRALFMLVALGAGMTSWATLATLDGLPRTDDARVSAETVHLSPGIPGRVVSLNVAENQRVAAGDLILTLEDTAYRLQRDQAAAQVDAARAALADATRAAEASARNAASAGAEIDRVQTNLDLARATVARLEPLAADGIASQQTLDEARAVAADAEVSLRVAQQTAAAADDLVANTDALQAELRAAEALLAQAQNTLSRAELRAPVAGFVTGLAARPGSWVLPEQPVLTLIDEESWHVEAFFRETDLAAIAEGDPVRVRVLSHNETALSGTIAAIGRGVLDTDAVRLPGEIPFVVQSTDWVRLAQRFPVRIALDPPLPDFLRLGASATVTLMTGPVP